MSKGLNERQYVLEAVHSYMSGCTLHLDETTLLAKGDQRLYSDAITLYVGILLDLLDFSSQRALNLVKTISRVPVVPFLDCLSSCDEILLALPAGMTSLTRRRLEAEFKQRLEGLYLPRALHKVILDFMYRIPDRSNAVEWFRSLHQLFAFLKRLPLEGNQDELRERAEHDYLAKEAEIRENQDLWRYNATKVYTLDRIIRHWFPWNRGSLLLSSMVPGHGPGAVAEEGALSLSEKYETFRFDKELWDFVSQIDPLMRVSPIFDDGRSLDRTSRVVFVPKTATKLRTICAEPAVLMYYQKAVARGIDSYIYASPAISPHIDLRRSELNRELAQVGSVEKYSTIDLSAASDSVSLSLVDGLFANTPLWDPMMSVRSHNFKLPSGQHHRMAKYAAMGSDVTFRLECMIFLAVCEQAALDLYGPEHSSNYRVYGDDIVIEDVLCQYAIGILEDIGFSVNTSKSYFNVFGSRFRESCGGEYLDGEDVTPIRLSRFFNGIIENHHQYDRYLATLDLANDLFTRGFKTSRRFLLTRLLALPEALRPLAIPDSEEGYGFKSSTPDNHHLRTRRWRGGDKQGSHVDYQRDEVLAGHIPPLKFNTWESGNSTSFSQEALRRMEAAKERDLWEQSRLQDTHRWVGPQMEPLGLEARWVPKP